MTSGMWSANKLWVYTAARPEASRVARWHRWAEDLKTRGSNGCVAGSLAVSKQCLGNPDQAQLLVMVVGHA